MKKNEKIDIVGEEENNITFDFSQLIELADGDNVFLTELVEDIIVHMDQSIDKLSLYFDQNNIQDLEATAHKLKSTLQLLGQNNLLEQVGQIEKLSHFNTLEKVPELIIDAQKLKQQLITQCKQLLSELN